MSQEFTVEMPEPDPSIVPAMLAGLGAALLGGIAWTIITATTGYEIGFAAWALGGFVGYAMSKSTRRRDTVVASTAAGLAIVGLLIARVLIGEFVMASQGATEILEDGELMTQAVTVDLQMTDGFPPALQAQYDALPDGDTIPDVLWDDMQSAAAAHLETLGEDERRRVAEQFTNMVLGQVGLVDRVTSQFSAFDLLWAFLAVSTAWGMLIREEEEFVAVEQQAEEEASDGT